MKVHAFGMGGCVRGSAAIAASVEEQSSAARNASENMQVATVAQQMDAAADQEKLHAPSRKIQQPEQPP